MPIKSLFFSSWSQWLFLLVLIFLTNDDVGATNHKKIYPRSGYSNATVIASCLNARVADNSNKWCSFVTWTSANLYPSRNFSVYTSGLSFSVNDQNNYAQSLYNSYLNSYPNGGSDCAAALQRLGKMKTPLILGQLLFKPLLHINPSHNRNHCFGRCNVCISMHECFPTMQICGSIRIFHRLFFTLSIAMRTNQSSLWISVDHTVLRHRLRVESLSYFRLQPIPFQSLYAVCTTWLFCG